MCSRFCVEAAYFAKSAGIEKSQTQSPHFPAQAQIT
jgi:hypothetical protein